MVEVHLRLLAQIWLYNSTVLVSLAVALKCSTTSLCPRPSRRTSSSISHSRAPLTACGDCSGRAFLSDDENDNEGFDDDNESPLPVDLSDCENDSQGFDDDAKPLPVERRVSNNARQLAVFHRAF